MKVSILAQDALSYLKSLPYLPHSTEGKHAGPPSKGEIKRWLKNSAVIINGKRPLPSDVVDYPVTELVFFPNGKRRTTMV